MLVSKNAKICVTPNANAKICVTPNANPQREQVKYIDGVGFDVSISLALGTQPERAFPLEYRL